MNIFLHSDWLSVFDAVIFTIGFMILFFVWMVDRDQRPK